jgi:hypothetical protein
MFVIETRRVFFEVGTQILNIIQMNFNILLFTGLLASNQYNL